MTLAAMTQEARPARHPGALRGNGPANNDSAGPVAQAGPGSSLAGAYLNQFNEMVKLIERLPGTPELIGDLLIWQPTSYQDYFTASAMPGRASATDVYASLNRCVRQNFEDVVDDLERKALGALAAIRRHHKTHGESAPTSSPTFAPAPERIFAKCSARHTISSVMFQAGRAISRRAGSSGLASLSVSTFTAMRLRV
jgi:hypothetical protein